MNEFDVTVGGESGLSGLAGGRHYVLESSEFSCAAQSLAVGDVVHLLQIPANTHVSKVWFVCADAEGAAEAVDIGDYLMSSGAAIDADGWLSAVSINSETTVCSTAITTVHDAALGITVSPAYGLQGKDYLAAAYLSATATGTHTVAKFKILAECVDLS